MAMYRSDKFKLIINQEDQKLLFNDKIILKGCENLLNLMAELGTLDESPQILIKYNLSDEELIDLEITIAKAILEDNKCMPDIHEDEM